MNDRTELITIGQLARRTGLSVRTIRFWSDQDVITPAGRSAAGYRLYDVAAVARLDLVHTLRQLGLDLDTVRQVLRRQTSVADVAKVHAAALDTEIRALQVRRAVLRSIAERDSTTEELRLMHKLANLTAQQRQRLIDDFVTQTFDGVDPQAPGARIATMMRQLPAELPTDPSREQIDAWVELAELVSDEQFQQRVREMAVTGARQPAEQPFDPARVAEEAGAALRAGIAPESADARQILDRIVDADLPGPERLRLAAQTETFTDRRVERYWQLLGVLNGWPAAPPQVPAMEWFIAALRAHAD
ncbi:MerR family transcriptional regulator [Solwaraspora sp. WMMD406]|uniref:helix-turn-helix domain-containing protein n=1 Tax=Solwaraspora sp. WMMD406 TaxID=3016095 RepID=UPI00241766A8|nr:MerR family transcriptional regulator [Solwaraspora sp. WMMD406]MDG4766169.1 MerR family transcriptional regulator [Solwaraspora sp. WMMD406]